MRSFISLLLVGITLIGSTQALECTIGYAEPDAQGHITGNPILAFMTCNTKCLTAFVKTAQHPTGTIAASCSADDTSSCDGSYVLDVNTWTEVKCCSTDRCNGPTGNFPWDGFNWAAPRDPLAPTSTSTTTDAPTSTTTTPSAPTSTITTNAPTTTSSTTNAPGTILCTAGTSVPDGSGGVNKVFTTQSCTQCYAIYTHSSVGPQNVGTIAGGCASSTNRECDFQGTVVTQQGQWVEVKCCHSGDNCNSQDWGAGQYDWTTPRVSSVTGTTTQPTTSTNPTTKAPTTSANPTNTPTKTPTGQPITGNNNTISSTGIFHSSATTVMMSHVLLMMCMMMVILSMIM